MNKEIPSAEDFKALLASAISDIECLRRREFIASKLIEPYQTTLRWEYGVNEPSSAWVFADLGERNVVAQYCLGGHGTRGFPWGINFRDHDHFGQDCGWYQSLARLVEDWGIEA
jgi:hypothetical protein